MNYIYLFYMSLLLAFFPLDFQSLLVLAGACFPEL